MMDLVGQDYPCLPTLRGCYVCPDCGTLVPVQDGCRKWSCPNCWRTPARRAIRALTARFLSQMHNMQHWVLSPPRGWYADDEKQDPIKMQNAASRIIRRDMPQMAGVAVLHPYRMIKKPAGIEVVTQRDRLEVLQRHLDGLNVDISDIAFDNTKIVSEEVMHRAAWLKLRTMPDWRDYVEFSPHIHYLAIGYMPYGVQEILRKRGWVIKRVRRLAGQRQFERTLMYLFSHTAYCGSRKKHYRIIIGKSWKLEKETTYEQEEFLTCFHCGGLMRFVDTDYKGYVSDLPAYIVKRRLIKWRLTSRK